MTDDIETMRVAQERIADYLLVLRVEMLRMRVALAHSACQNLPQDGMCPHASTCDCADQAMRLWAPPTDEVNGTC